MRRVTCLLVNGRWCVQLMSANGYAELTRYFDNEYNARWYADWARENWV